MKFPTSLSPADRGPITLLRHKPGRRWIAFSPIISTSKFGLLRRSFSHASSRAWWIQQSVYRWRKHTAWIPLSSAMHTYWWCRPDALSLYLALSHAFTTKQSTELQYTLGRVRNSKVQKDPQARSRENGFPYIRSRKTSIALSRSFTDHSRIAINFLYLHQSKPNQWRH